MESEAELKKIKDKVLRKIGRNILLFQKAEQMLKFIISNGKLSGYVSDMKSNQERRNQNIDRLTMGHLARLFFDEIHSEEILDAPEELKEAYISFGFKVECSAIDYENKKKVLASIVADRNELIHHLLPKFDFDINSIKNCREIDHYLDQQHKKLLPELDMLKNTIEIFEDLKKGLAELLNSDDGKKHFRLLLLRNSRLAILLKNIAAKAARRDGWTFMSTAGHLIRQYASEEMTVLNPRYGHKKLKNFIMATELFDIEEEPTDKGGIRLLYRLKTD